MVKYVITCGCYYTVPWDGFGHVLERLGDAQSARLNFRATSRRQGVGLLLCRGQVGQIGLTRAPGWGHHLNGVPALGQHLPARAGRWVIRCAQHAWREVTVIDLHGWHWQLLLLPLFPALFALPVFTGNIRPRGRQRGMGITLNSTHFKCKQIQPLLSRRQVTLKQHAAGLWIKLFPSLHLSFMFPVAFHRKNFFYISSNNTTAGSHDSFIT